MQRMGMEGYGKLGIVDSEVAQNSSLKYYCMSCGTQHKDIECPKCGSKMKKVGF
jgi:rubrerythrin